MSIDQELLRVSAECDRLIAERDALIRAVADHVTVRAEQYAQIQALAARVQEMRGLLEDSCRPEPPTKDTGCCISCGSWTPHGNPERHAHEDDCEAWKTYIAIRARTPSLAKKAIITPDTSAQILARRDAAIWMEAAEVCEAFTPTYVKDSERWLKGQNGNPDIRLKDIAPRLEAAFEMEQVLKHGSVIHQLTDFDKCGKALRAKADELLKGLEKAP